MAGFDPATIALLREQLRETNAQHKRDLNQRSKMPTNSKSKMAQRLDSRIGEAVRVARDLDRLIPFMEALNAEEPDGLPPGLRRAEWAVLADQYFAEQVAGASSASVLSHTPLATAFGAAPVAEPRDPEAGAR